MSEEQGIPPGATSEQPLYDGPATAQRQRDSATWGRPDVDAVERMVAALGADVVEGTRVYRDELTVVVAAAYLRDVAQYLRDHEGYDFLSDVTAVDYLGFEGELAGYWGGAGRDMNRAGSWGKDHVPDAPPKRFGVSVHVAKVLTVDNGGHRRLRVQAFVDDGEAVPSLVPVYPSADYHEREAWDMFGIPFEGHPNLRAHPDAGRLGRAPAAQGLPPRRRARPVLGRGLTHGDDRDGDAADLAAQGRAAARAVGAAPVLRQPGPARDQHRAEPPVDARRAAAGDGARRRAGGRPAAGDRLRAHRHREEHRAEDVLEGDHVRPAHGLPLVLQRRDGVLHGHREGARPRGAAPRGVDPGALPGAQPHPLAPDLPRHGLASTSAGSRCSSTASATATSCSTCSRWSPASACTRATARSAASARTCRAASSASAARSSSACARASTSTTA